MATGDELRDKTKAELQDMAEELGVATSGTKDEIADRIEAALAEAQDPAAETEAAEVASSVETDSEPGPYAHAELTEAQIAAAEVEAAGNVRDARVVLPPVVVPTADDHPVIGSWIMITVGEHVGTHAHYFQDVSYNRQGLPVRVLVRTRDAANEVLELDYDDITRTEYTGGR